MRAYFISDYANAPLVRHVHWIVPLMGVEPTSRWAEEASGPERLAELGQEKVRELAAQNDRDLASSHVGVVIAREGLGGELFCEAARALERDIPLIWVGPRTVLTTFREGVLRVPNIAAAGLVLHIFSMFLRSQGYLSDDEQRAALWLIIEWTNTGEDSSLGGIAVAAE